MLYKLRYNGNQNGIIKNENGTMKMRTLQYNPFLNGTQQWVIMRHIAEYQWEKIIVAYWRHMVTQIWVNTDSGNGLVPDGTKPLPEQMLTSH